QALHHKQNRKAAALLRRVFARPLDATFQRVVNEYVDTLRDTRLEFSTILLPLPRIQTMLAVQ
ncbi:MAG: hypothetical protein MJE68_16140, partial [Proteobacteria bacterium]|nr:hypothetical protein [Pseudomonadota bacterium]